MKSLGHGGNWNADHVSYVVEGCILQVPHDSVGAGNVLVKTVEMGRLHSTL